MQIDDLAKHTIKNDNRRARGLGKMCKPTLLSFQCVFGDMIIFLEIGGHRRNSAGLVGAEDHRRRKESRRQRHGGTGNWNDGTAGVSHRGKK